MLALVGEGNVELAANVLVDARRHADAAGFRHRFQTRRHIDAVAENVAAVDDDVADVDADAELDALVGGDLGVARDHAALQVDRAAHRIDDALELHQNAVVGGLDDAPAVLRDLGIDQLPPVRLHLAERAFLVGAHQPAVAGDVGRKNSREPPLNPIAGQDLLAG